MLNKILENYPEHRFIYGTGLEKAVIGLEESSMRLIMSKKKIIDILTEDMSEEDALEHYSFNIERSHGRENTPILCEDYFY